MFTVLGARGFIGSHLAASLAKAGEVVECPDRGAELGRDNLGHVMYCLGLTADFRERPFETVEAHVCVLRELLECGNFNSLLYLSSTRVYGSGDRGDEEADLTVNPNADGDLYNLSKLMGESLCLAAAEGVRIVRLSNVFGFHPGNDNFLQSLILEALETGRVQLRTALDSEKDYISIEDVVQLLPKIATSGRHRLYNVAAGRNTKHAKILSVLSKVLDAECSVDPEAPVISYPLISIDRARREFAFSPTGLEEALPGLIEACRRGR